MYKIKEIIFELSIVASKIDVVIKSNHPISRAIIVCIYHMIMNFLNNPTQEYKNNLIKNQQLNF